MLLGAGADPRAKDVEDDTPYSTAVAANMQGVVSILSEYEKKNNVDQENEAKAAKKTEDRFFGKSKNKSKSQKSRKVKKVWKAVEKQLKLSA